MQERRIQGYRSFAGRLSFWIILLGALVFAAVLGTNYYLSRYLLEDYIGDLALQTVSSTGHEIETVFRSVASDAELMAALVSDAGVDEKQVHDILRATIRNNPDIFGMTVALEPNVLDEDLGEFSPYYFRKGGDLGYSDLADPGYRYREWDWYTEPRARDTGVWTEPYLDTGGGDVLMTTYSVPIRLSNDGGFAGVATADIELDWLERIVNGIRIGETGFGFIVSKNDTVIAHPDRAYNMKPLADILTDEVRLSSWQQYINDRYSGDTLLYKAPCRHREGDCRAVVEPVAETGWKVIIIIPEQELQDDVNALTLKISLIAVFGLLVLVFAVIAITRYLTSPLGQLARATREIGAGELDTELPAPVHRDEIGLLTSDFTTMRDSLKRYIEELTEATASRQKLESEIQIAKDIQMSMVPGAGNLSVENAQYQLFAFLQAARSVGGDLYYCQQEDGRLHFVIGDVSDKGVPAALFMAKAVTLYNGAVNENLTPGDIFSRMNEALCQNNDACMFVTALCGTLDLDRGELVMSNAGHMPPLLHGTASASELPVDGGPALGLVEDIEYPNISARLEPGTRLVLYTDGISEAFNQRGEQYGDDRLAAFVANSDARTAEALARNLLDDLDGFVDGALQSDDITLMVLQYEP